MGINSKSEILNPKQIRNSNFEIRYCLEIRV